VKKMEQRFVDTLAGRWVLGVLITLGITIITLIATSFSGWVHDSKDGAKAMKENALYHPKIDSICQVLSVKDEKENAIIRASKEDYDRRTYRDSVRVYETLQQMDRLVDKLIKKPK
jgi:hypothetical protein